MNPMALLLAVLRHARWLNTPVSGLEAAAMCAHWAAGGTDEPTGSQA